MSKVLNTSLVISVGIVLSGGGMMFYTIAKDQQFSKPYNNQITALEQNVQAGYDDAITHWQSAPESEAMQNQFEYPVITDENMLKLYCAVPTQGSSEATMACETLEKAIEKDSLVQKQIQTIHDERDSKNPYSDGDLMAGFYTMIGGLGFMAIGSIAAWGGTYIGNRNERNPAPEVIE